MSKRTITMTDRPPVEIDEDSWPVIAVSKWWDNQHECQANRRASIRVREHTDGHRFLVYGVASSQFQGEAGASAGYLVELVNRAQMRDVVDAIRIVAAELGRIELGRECIADLPAEPLE